MTAAQTDDRLEFIFLECPEHGLTTFAGRIARFTKNSLGVAHCSKCGRKLVEAAP